MRMNNNYLFNFRGMDLAFKSPIFIGIERFEIVAFELASAFFCIIAFLFLVDGVLIYSITLNDIEERTYEFAMLRTLGFENKSLAVLLVIQTLVQSIPATAIGFLLNFITSYVVKIFFAVHMDVKFDLQM